MPLRDVLLILLIGGGFAFAAQEDVPEVAQRKLDEANRHREGGRHEEAIARYREVIDAAPGVLEAYIGLGALYHESEQYPKALEVFSSGLKRFPNDATLLFNVAATEAKLEQFNGNLKRAAVELAKDWRTDRVLRRLEALMVIADLSDLLVISGAGDVIEPDDGVIAIGSGGNYALAAARVLVKHTQLDARVIAEEAMRVAAGICVYTNDQLTFEELS